MPNKGLGPISTCPTKFRFDAMSNGLRSRSQKLARKMRVQKHICRLHSSGTLSMWDSNATSIRIIFINMS